MIKLAQDRLGPGQGDAVIEGGRGVKQDLGRPIDADADDVPRGSKGAGKAGQHGQPGNGQHDPHPVGDAVGDLFGSRIVGRSRILIHCFTLLAVQTQKTDLLQTTSPHAPWSIKAGRPFFRSTGQFGIGIPIRYD